MAPVLARDDGAVRLRDPAEIAQAARLALLIAFVAFLGVELAFAATPLLSSDEYAFFVMGRYLDRLPELFALDPALQRVPNFAFFALVHKLSQWTDAGAFAFLMRLVHLAEYLATGYVLLKSVEGVDGDGHAGAWRNGVLLAFVLPSSMYLFAVMPEVDLLLVTACIGYAVLVVVPRSAIGGALLAGVLTGVALMVKPHAVAVLASVVGYLLLLPCLGSRALRPRIAAVCIALYLVVAFAVIVFIGHRYTSEWRLDPRVLLGFNFYGQFIHDASADAHGKLFAVATYVAGHLVVIALVFAPPIVFFVREAATGLRAPPVDAPGDRSARLAAFALLMVGSHVAMTAWFTAGVGQVYESEAFRLHGRYLTPALMWLAVAYFRALRGLQGRWLGAAALLTVAALSGCIAFVVPTFKIFPWDYPLLFAFFRAPNHYGWDFDGSFATAAVRMSWALGAICVAMALGRTMTRRCLVAVTLVVLAVANVQAYRWVYERTKGSRETIDAARAVSLLTGSDRFGRGLLIADNRYGDASSILFNLANAPRVVEKPPNARLSDDDVKGADWVLVKGEFAIDFAYLQSATIGPFRFFPGGSGLSFRTGPRPALSAGKSVVLTLAEGKYPSGALDGFNAAEPWGRWTSATRATVDLPVTIRGRVKVTFFGWTLPENRGAPLLIRAGSASATLAMPVAGAENQVTLDVPESTDRLDFESPVFRPEGSGRALGTAIGRISIEAS